MIDHCGLKSVTRSRFGCPISSQLYTMPPRRSAGAAAQPAKRAASEVSDDDGQQRRPRRARRQQQQRMAPSSLQKRTANGRKNLYLVCESRAFDEPRTPTLAAQRADSSSAPTSSPVRVHSRTHLVSALHCLVLVAQACAYRQPRHRRTRPRGTPSQGFSGGRADPSPDASSGRAHVALEFTTASGSLEAHYDFARYAPAPSRTVRHCH